MLIDNSKHIEEISNEFKSKDFYNEEIFELFYNDIIKKICWNSNSIEGNTLTLEETIKLIDYDETEGNHKYNEYFEAKCLYNAIKKYMIPNNQIEINEEWICNVNNTIMGNKFNDFKSGEAYRKEPVGVGNIVKIEYIAPPHEEVPKLMNEYVDIIKNTNNENISTFLKQVAINHLEFERIHPFKDGNGRTGRLILNQMLMNNKLLPIYFSNNSDYRNSFKIYNNYKDYSKLLNLICKGEINSINDFYEYDKKYKQKFEFNYKGTSKK